VIGRAGFEPATNGLKVSASGPLSYHSVDVPNPLAGTSLPLKSNTKAISSVVQKISKRIDAVDLPES